MSNYLTPEGEPMRSRRSKVEGVDMGKPKRPYKRGHRATLRTLCEACSHPITDCACNDPESHDYAWEGNDEEV